LQTRVGFIGLGQIGKPMAINVANKGFDLMVYDLQQEPLKALASSGAKIASSPKEVGSHSEVVQIALRDGVQVESVILGESGVLGAMASGSAIAIHSTIHPKIVKNIGELAKARNVGVIDAAISGGETGAREGKLAYMIGGDKEWVEKCRPVLVASGANIFHVGELGKGLTAKLCHQLMLCINMISAYEGMLLGKRAGIDAKILQDIVHHGSAQSAVIDNWQRYNRSYDTVPQGFPLFYKDLGVALEFAHDLGLSLPGSGLVHQLINPVLGIEK
jgi:3-hydroxyisobutyrate dehydrogenase-like beta-hydroxyacid dehydrogenase